MAGVIRRESLRAVLSLLVTRRFRHAGNLVASFSQRGVVSDMAGVIRRESLSVSFTVMRMAMFTAGITRYNNTRPCSGSVRGVQG
ncbi:MAG: hypothetical protein IJG36_06170 [Synergistaceae bacterium]|nr:hypothetical protein [Synergistaceae bacterium]